MFPAFCSFWTDSNFTSYKYVEEAEGNFEISYLKKQIHFFFRAQMFFLSS